MLDGWSGGVRARMGDQTLIDFRVTVTVTTCMNARMVVKVGGRDEPAANYMGASAHFVSPRKHHTR